MKPDVNLFDKPDRAKEAKDFIAKNGTYISKTAQKAGKGILAAARTIKESVGKSKEKRRQKL